MEAVRRLEARVGALSAENAVWLCQTTLIFVGLALRARGFLWDTIGLWQDEADWAGKLINLPLSGQLIRPIGFMAVCKLLVYVFSASETVLRVLPWLGGIATVVMAPGLAARLFSSSAARLLFVGIIALHPGAIDLSKEFKPYAVGLALHMAYLLFALRYVESHKARELAILLGLLLIGVLFAQDTLFAFPGLFALLLFEAFRTRRVRQLAAIALTATATLGIIVVLFFTNWHTVTDDDENTVNYWGNKYDVFYVHNSVQGSSRAGWTAAHIAELAALPGTRRDQWHERWLSRATLSKAKRVDSVAWVALALLGLGVLAYRRRGREALLLVGPVVVLVIFNAFGAWPLGAFRTNLFALVYAAGVAATALDVRRWQLSGWEIMPVGALVLAPYLLLDRSNHGHKAAMAGGSAFPAALQQLVQLDAVGSHDRGRSLVALDDASCWPWRYYTRYHPDKARAAELTRRFDARCEKSFERMASVARRGLVSSETRAFLLFSNDNEMREAQAHLPKDLDVDAQVYVGRRDQLVLRLRSRDPLVR